jgi:3-hydroxybutyryl-CoA dehydrogenase
MEQSDLVGLDLTLAIHETLIQHLDRTTGPHPYLRSKIVQGKLGMKTGEGFRRWTPQQADEVRQRLSRFLADQAKARKQTSQPS